MSLAVLRSICSWPCSFYTQDRRWVKGVLHLKDENLEFWQSETNEKCFECMLTDIQSLNKETTSIFYGAITIVIEKQKHWFSSFLSRTDVVNKVEYFKRELLLGGSSGRAGNNPKNELLDIAYNSQNTLAQSAKMLHEQGRQLDKTASMLNTIHGDLNVSDRIVDDLDSWLGIWCDKGTVMRLQRHHVNHRRNPHLTQIEYSVLSAKSQHSVHQSSQLVISEKLMSFYGANSSLIIEFVLKEISVLIAHTPWDVTVRKVCIGKADQQIHFITKDLIHIVQSLKVFCPHAIEFQYPEDDGNFAESDGKSLVKSNLTGSSCRPLVRPMKGSAEADTGIVGPGLTKDKTKALSESEANELSRVLSSMKTMASDIIVEQEKQLEQLDGLNESTAAATDRVHKNQRVINKLL